MKEFGRRKEVGGERRQEEGGRMKEVARRKEV